MAKVKLGSSRAEALIIDTQKREDMQIEDVVIQSKSAIEKSNERRNKRVQGVLRPSEYELFVNNIGRMSESDAIRELILIATDQPTNKPKERLLIINLLKKSKQI